MTLGIVFKGPEGIVLAADSRVTLTAELTQPNGQKVLLPSTFDNATKLLHINGQNFVGVVTYSLGGFGTKSPRTAHSYIPEFESELSTQGNNRLSVEEFSKKFSAFFVKQWNEVMPKKYSEQNMEFLIGGYDEGEPYGRVFRFGIPSKPDPVEQNPGKDTFGLSWGGQMEYTNRLIKGFDPELPYVTQKILNLTDDQRDDLKKKLQDALSLQIPYQLLPLQDCVDLSMFLIKTTMDFQTWQVGIRGVGGAIDIATITRTDGFKAIQLKHIRGGRND